MILNGRTDVGKRRRNNQDSFVIKKYGDLSLALVCDGMGGASGGNIASKLACDEFIRVADARISSANGRPLTEGDYSSMLAHAVASANQAVFRRAEADTGLKGMGTTLVGALVTKDTLYAVNVGDSRLYLFANGHLRQVTHDHSLVQYLIDAGKLTKEEAKTYPNRNVITRAIGIERTVDADIFSADRMDRTPNLLLLLCSDGLSSYVDQTVIEDILSKAVSAPVYDGEAAVNALIDAANLAGGADNVTAILLNPADSASEEAVPGTEEGSGETAEEAPASESEEISEEVPAEEAPAAEEASGAEPSGSDNADVPAPAENADEAGNG